MSESKCKCTSFKPQKYDNFKCQNCHFPLNEHAVIAPVVKKDAPLDLFSRLIHSVVGTPWDIQFSQNLFTICEELSKNNGLSPIIADAVKAASKAAKETTGEYVSAALQKRAEEMVPKTDARKWFLFLAMNFCQHHKKLYEVYRTYGLEWLSMHSDASVDAAAAETLRRCELAFLFDPMVELCYDMVQTERVTRALLCGLMIHLCAVGHADKKDVLENFMCKCLPYKFPCPAPVWVGTFTAVIMKSIDRSTILKILYSRIERGIGASSQQFWLDCFSNLEVTSACKMWQIIMSSPMDYGLYSTGPDVVLSVCAHYGNHSDIITAMRPIVFPKKFIATQYMEYVCLPGVLHADPVQTYLHQQFHASLSNRDYVAMQEFCSFVQELCVRKCLDKSLLALLLGELVLRLAQRTGRRPRRLPPIAGWAEATARRHQHRSHQTP